MRRLTSAVAAAGLVVTSSLLLTFAPAQATENTSSALTKNGTGEFSDLEVTVSQTRNLVDQIVRVSWRGAQKTVPGSGQYSYNYLQIMQCWGDDPSGPDREQCQYGGLTGDDRGGAMASTRQVSYGSLTVDPLETIQKPSQFQQAFVPFRSVTGTVENGQISEFYNRFTTNEVPFAATRGDGTGTDYFSVQTAREAPGLGCGAPVTQGGATKGRSCWLVVVPRGDREVDGDQATLSNKLISSPLGVSNWQNRLAFPLEFEPAGDNCPLGKEERRTLGQESIAEAVLRWQPVLCAGDGSVFSYSRLSDDDARSDVLSDEPGLSFVSRPVPQAEVPKGKSLTYAPVGISGLTIGFNVDRRTPVRAPAEVKARDGERVTSMRLTPRLVAKLLTQSYTKAANIDSPSVQGNPTDLMQDPEFTSLNPEYDGLTVSLPELQLPAGRADITQRLWEWVLLDRDARAFMNGTPDPSSGMRINADFRPLKFPRPDFPKADSYCVEVDGRPDLCTIDAHPYAASMQEAARNAARGDFKGLTYWDPIAVPVPAYKRDGLQPSGSRSMLALTDTASAARFGLETAQLANADGSFVSPTPTSMMAAVKVLDKSSKAPQPDLSNKDPKAYPLTNITYAVTDIAGLAVDARKDYSTFLKYAAGPGQQPGALPGQLPEGYVPLTKAMAASTTKAAAQVAAGPTTTTTTPDDETDDGGSKGGGTDNGGPQAQGSGFGFGNDGQISPRVIEAGMSDVPDASTTDARVEGDGQSETTAGEASNDTLALITGSDPMGTGRWVPIIALVLGVLAALVGPGLIMLPRLVRL